MLLNPIIGMLHNTKAERWHPIIFSESPLPGPYSEDKPVRHKSCGHHTVGFATRAEAMANIMNEMVVKLPEAKLALEKDFVWDGEDVPALVVFFGEVDGVLQPLL